MPVYTVVKYHVKENDFKSETKPFSSNLFAIMAIRTKISEDHYLKEVSTGSFGREKIVQAGTHKVYLIKWLMFENTNPVQKRLGCYVKCK